VFLVAAPFAGIALLVSLFLKEVKLHGRSGMAGEQQEDNQVEATADQHWNDRADHQSRVHHGHAGSGNGVVEPNARRAAVESIRAPGEVDQASAGALTGTDLKLLTVSGTVRQSGSRPLVGARLTLTDQAGSQVARTVSGEDGDYLLPLESGGSYLLIVAATHLSPAASLVTLTDHPVRRDVTLSGRSTITGRVLATDTETGTAIGRSDALVTLTDATGQVVGSTRSRHDGGYSFEQLTAGCYVLTAQSGQHRPLARSIEVPESGALACDLVLTGGGRLAGTVLAASDGRPVREARVTLVDSDGQVVAGTTTGDEGGYLFADLGAGRYILTAAGYAPVAVEVAVEEDAVSTAPVRLGAAAGVADRGGVPAEVR